MAPVDIQFVSTPAGSIALRPLQEHDTYLALLSKVPPSLKSMLTSLRTGAYIRGLTKVYNLPPEVASTLAFTVLIVACGEKTLAELPALLSSTLGLANDKAQSIAQEIERELFASSMLEYNQSLRSQKAAASPSLQPSAGAQNVLDLKQQVANHLLQTPSASRPATSLRPATPAPIPRPPVPKSVFPPPPSSPSSRPPNVPW